MTGDLSLSFGEYLRRLRRAKRWQLQQLATASGLSATHLSRLENDNALPNVETVVKLARALDGDLDRMLELADCLPREILDRLLRRAEGSSTALRRAVPTPAVDPGFAQALVEEMDPALRRALARAVGLSERDAAGLFRMLQRLAQMPSAERESVVKFLLPSSEEAS
jgi:transcriptional regulator with XRE-family HTH domain